MAKLEVYIRVHFALWPRAHNQPEEVQEKAMGELKLFFEQQKSSLGKDSTILPLYALPFVEDPFSHPIFKELFRVRMYYIIIDSCTLLHTFMYLGSYFIIFSHH